MEAAERLNCVCDNFSLSAEGNRAVLDEILHVARRLGYASVCRGRDMCVEQPRSTI